MTDTKPAAAKKDDDKSEEEEKVPKMTYTIKNDTRKFNEYDAIFGQGGRANQYRNGTMFRQLVIQHSDAYSSIPSRDSAAKHKFVFQQVVDPLLAKGGRFFCLEQGKIKELDLAVKKDAKVMMTKIQQALRDERKRTRAHLRQKQEAIAKTNPPDKVVKAGPYDTVFGLNCQAKAARQGSVYEKLIGNLSDTYHAMDQQYNHHAPYTKYDFVREQVIKPLQQQGGRFFYVENGELVELKYHENTDCKVIMSRIQQAFDMEHKRKNPDALTSEETELLRGTRVQYHQRTLPGAARANQYTTANTNTTTPTPATINNTTTTGTTGYQLKDNNGGTTSYQLNKNFNRIIPNNVASKNIIISNAINVLNKPQPQVQVQVQTSHPVIGATDTAMQALRQALQPALQKPAPKNQRLSLPTQIQANNASNGNSTNSAVNNETNRTTDNNNNSNSVSPPQPPQHDLGDDFDSLYTRHDTFFGPALDQYHQKSVFCALVAQCCNAYNSIPSHDFRARQEFVFTQIMEPLLTNDGRFFILQEGVLKELDLYDETDCRVLLTNIQQAFFDDSKKRKRRGSLSSPLPPATVMKSSHHPGQPYQATEGTEGDEEEYESDDDGMFSDAEEQESTTQPVLGIDEETVHALFENLRNKIQLTI